MLTGLPEPKLFNATVMQPKATTLALELGLRSSQVG